MNIRRSDEFETFLNAFSSGEYGACAERVDSCTCPGGQDLDRAKDGLVPAG